MRFALYLPFLLAAASSSAVDFSTVIYPLLQRACFECHGAENDKGGLRLHAASGLAKADHQEILRRVSLPRSDKEAMPKRGDALTQMEIQNLRDWIGAGAIWPETLNTLKHWSYVPPRRPELPAVTETTWQKNPVDRFIMARLEKTGIDHSPEAEPAVLYRRLSLDLTGLPPAIADVDAFIKAYTKDADQSVLAAADKLLASKEFGVRWASPWLDAARYADSHGFQRDDLRQIWGFRDWVVDALNADMPFDRFTIEQVAGDLLPKATPQQIIATGFHRCTPTNVEAGSEPEETRINQVIDRVNTTGAIWLGSTLECAQCHNHKYDPFSQRDYYGLLAYFNNTEREAERTNLKTPSSIQFKGVPMPLPSPELATQRQALQAKIKQVDAQIQKLTPPSAKPTAASSQVTALKPLSFESESGADSTILADQSVLLSGDPPDEDEYSVLYELPAGSTINALMVEALSDDSLPGKGPGRGNAGRPNFVLQHLEAKLTSANDKNVASQTLTFQSAQASFSQSTFLVTNLADDKPETGWAIMPRFGESHWAALTLKQPLQVTAGTQLQLRLVQKFGGGRVIGRLRVSAISGDVIAALPKAEKTEEKAIHPRVAKLERQRSTLNKQLAELKPATTEIMRELPEPRMTGIFKRGVYTDVGDAVKPDTPAIIQVKASAEPNRLSLARWLVNRDNPLTARVTINRWWAELFGRGIVATVEDFGIKGATPTHPELLDWLAVEFMESGWSMKQVLKIIVTSRTYRQSSNHGTSSKDPENTLHWRGPRHRMDAEAIRDNALAIAGLLNLKQGGEPIRPPQPEGLWAKVGGQQYKYEVSPGTEQHRRGLYVVLKRGAPYPSFVNFDASARMACVVKRSRSNTPLQALTLLNDPVYVEAAQALAQRILRESKDSVPEARIRYGFRLAIAREPRPQEMAVLKKLFEASKADNAWFSIATALLNLDETITKG